MPIVGIVLVVLGVVGLVSLVVVGAAYEAVNTPVPPAVAPTPSAPQPPSDVTVGESIYVRGVGAGGAITNTGGPVWFQRMGGGCALCHGVDGRGRVVQMMGVVTDSPDIRYSTLSQIGSAEPSATVGAWNDDQIIRAIREGVEPDGKSLDADMPRWNLTNANAQALLDYMKELR